MQNGLVSGCIRTRICLHQWHECHLLVCGLLAPPTGLENKCEDAQWSPLLDQLLIPTEKQVVCKIEIGRDLISTRDLIGNKKSYGVITMLVMRQIPLIGLRPPQKKAVRLRQCNAVALTDLYYVFVMRSTHLFRTVFCDLYTCINS